MESEELFSQPAVHSEDLILSKENLGHVIEEVETDDNLLADESAPTEEITTNPTVAPDNSTKTTTDNSNNTKDKPAEKTNEQRVTHLPLSRIRNLMKLDPDLNVASLEAVVTVAKATEMFIDSLAKESFVHTSQAKKKTVQKRDVDMAIASVDSLMFLEGAMNF